MSDLLSGLWLCVVLPVIAVIMVLRLICTLFMLGALAIDRHVDKILERCL